MKLSSSAQGTVFLGLGLVARILRLRPVGMPAGDLCLGWFGLMYRGWRGVRTAVEVLRAEGHTTLRQMADALNARGMMTRRGGRWHVSNVKNLLERLVA